MRSFELRGRTAAVVIPYRLPGPGVVDVAEDHVHSCGGKTNKYRIIYYSAVLVLWCKHTHIYGDLVYI